MLLLDVHRGNDPTPTNPFKVSDEYKADIKLLKERKLLLSGVSLKTSMAAENIIEQIKAMTITNL